MIRGMPQFVIAWLFNIAALALASALLGEHFEISADSDDTLQLVIVFAAAGLIFTVINVYVAPAIKVLSLPFIIITFGLFLLVINALLLLLTAWITGLFGLTFEINGFWWAVLASLVISLTNAVLATVFRD